MALAGDLDQSMGVDPQPARCALAGLRCKPWLDLAMVAGSGRCETSRGTWTERRRMGTVIGGSYRTAMVLDLAILLLLVFYLRTHCTT